jgi:small subunit ribosomal protein S16
VVADVRVKRQGAYLEKLGQYDPIETVPEKQVVVNVERYNHWIGLGAQASEAVSNLVRKFGGKQVAPVAKTPAPTPSVAVATPAAPAKK